MLCRSIDLDEDGGISGTTFCAALCCYSQKVIEAGVAFDVGLCGLAKADMTCQHGQQHAGEHSFDLMGMVLRLHARSEVHADMPLKAPSGMRPAVNWIVLHSQ